MGLEKQFVFVLFALLAGVGLVLHMLGAQSTNTNVGVAFALIASLTTLGWGLAHYAIFVPLRRLAVMAKAVGSGDFSQRLDFDRHDDLGHLAHELDALCRQLETAQLASERHIAALEQLRHSDRIATLGRLASSVAHELGNPLNVIELRAQLITSGGVETFAQARQNANVIVEQTKRMTRIINEILSFARMQPPKIARVDLVGVLRKAVALSVHTTKKHKTSISLNVPEREIEIDGDADKLLQVIVNLVVNGVQAMPNGGTLQVSTCDELRAPPDDPEGSQQHYVCVDVVDHGGGILAQHVSKVFDPFFSTKSTEGGTGLGLSVAQGIAREHEGWISVTSEFGHGAAFRVHLPKQSVLNGHGHAS